MMFMYDAARVASCDSVGCSWTVEGGGGQTRARHMCCLQAHVTRELPSLVCDELGEGARNFAVFILNLDTRRWCGQLPKRVFSTGGESAAVSIEYE
jgi:hypothetical protein